METASPSRPDRPHSVRKNAVWYVVGSSVYALCRWAILSILAKATTIEVVGQFGLGLAICSPVILFTNLHLRAIQATDAKGEYSFSDYVSVRIITTLLGLTAILLVVLVWGLCWQAALIVMAVALAKTFEGVSDILYGYFQKVQRLEKVSMFLLVRGLASVAALAGVLALGAGPVAALFSMALVWLAILAFVEFPGAFRMLGETLPLKAFRLRPGLFWTLVRLSLPLGIATMLGSLAFNVPRYMIESFVDSRSLGVFTAISYFWVAGSLFVNSMGQAAIPRMAQQIHKGKKKEFVGLFLRMLVFSFFLGLLMIAVVHVAGRQILRLLYTAEIAEYHGVFSWVAFASAIQYLSQVFQFALTALRKLKMQLAINLASVVTIVVGGAFLIPRYELQGAAWSMLIGFVAQLALSAGALAVALRSPEKKGTSVTG